MTELANEFNPDWDQVEVLQESLREYMAEIQRLRAALAHSERFAALVAAEREECAKLCDGWTQADGDCCAEAIRARGQHD